MNIHSCFENEIQIVAASGRVDSENAMEFEEKVRTAIEETASGVVLDLAETQYMASAGLRAILLVAKELETRKVQFALCSVSKEVLNVLKIAGFLRLMDAIPTREEAVARLAQA